MTEFESNIIAVYGVKGKEWLAKLPSIVAGVAERWGLLGLAAVPNLSFNYVLSGFQGARPIILKLGLDVEALRREAAALQTFAGYRAVEVLAQQQ